MLTTTQTLAGFLLATAGVLGQVTSCSGSPCEDKVAAFPECAVGCIEEAALAVGCVHGDYQCHCSKIDELQTSAALCVVNACNDGDIIGKLITEQVPAMCACVAANPTPPCTAVPEPTVTPTPSSSTPPTKPTVIPTCPGKECAFPDPPQCVIDCMTPVIEPYKCSGLDDWNCMCTNIRAIARNANDCLGKTCASGVAVAFNNAAIKGCTCLGAACPSSSSSSAPPPVTTTTPPVVDTTTTSAPPDTTSPPATCAHPCAASISAVPGCATACITSAASVVGCGNNDYNCRCASSAIIQNSAINCVIGACGIGEALNVPPAVQSLCGCVAASPATSCEGAGPTSTGGGGSDGPGLTTTTATTRTGGEGSGTTSTSTGDEGEETPCPEESSGQNSFVTKTVEVTTSICDEDDESSTSKPTAKPSCIGGCDGGDDDGGDDGSDDDGGDDDGGDDDGGDDDGGDDEGEGPSPSFPSGGNGGGSTPTTKPPGGGSSPTPTGGKPPVSTAGAAVNVVKVGSGIAGLIAAVAAFL